MNPVKVYGNEFGSWMVYRDGEKYPIRCGMMRTEAEELAKKLNQEQDAAVAWQHQEDNP